MNKHILGISTLLCLSALSLLRAQSDGRLPGRWQGNRSERNPRTGQTFTIELSFQFHSDGSYVEEARLGRLVILKLQGNYSIERGRKPGDPSVTHLLTLVPTQLQTAPAPEDLQLLQIADLPNVERTEQYTFFYNLAPYGGLTLQNRDGGETWGLQKVQ
jgi:hypothetical protein